MCIVSVGGESGLRPCGYPLFKRKPVVAAMVSGFTSGVGGVLYQLMVRKKLAWQLRAATTWQSHVQISNAIS